MWKIVHIFNTHNRKVLLREELNRVGGGLHRPRDETILVRQHKSQRWSMRRGQEDDDSQSVSTSHLQDLLEFVRSEELNGIQPPMRGVVRRRSSSDAR